MKKLPSLSLICALVLFGGWRVGLAWQSPPTSEGAPSPEVKTEKKVAASNPEAQAIVLKARDQLFQRQSVRADLVQVVTLGDYRFQTQGLYLSATDFRYRLEYTARLDDLEGRFLEVCDGQILHTRRQISEARPSVTSTAPPDIELARRDIQKILREARLNHNNPAALRAAEVGLGGLTSVLASLERTMIFDAVRTETVEGKEYLVVQGRWKQDQAEMLLMGIGPLSGQVAGFMPDLVHISFARETLFPEKFLYLKQTDESGRSFRPMISVEFKNVVLDQPVPAQQFAFVALPGYEERDETAQYLEMIRQAPAPGTAAPQPAP